MYKLETPRWCCWQINVTQVITQSPTNVFYWAGGWEIATQVPRKSHATPTQLPRNSHATPTQLPRKTKRRHLARKLESANCRPSLRCSKLIARVEKSCVGGHGGERMCVSQNVWMYVLSAAIGGIISFLLLKFWNLPQNEATRNLKIPVEHDERWG